jgi:hypothetical protein
VYYNRQSLKYSSDQEYTSSTDRCADRGQIVRCAYCQIAALTD